MLLFSCQLNEETGNRRPVMLSINTADERTAAAKEDGKLGQAKCEYNFVKVLQCYPPLFPSPTPQLTKLLQHVGINAQI